MELLVQQLANGLMTGSIYVMVALGIIITLNVLHVANLAHGAFVMLGGFVTYFLMSLYGINFFVALIVSFIVVGIFSVVVEKLVVRPCRLKGLSILVASVALVGVAFTIDEVASLLWGLDSRMVPVPFGGQPIIIWGIHLSVLRLVIPFIGIVSIILLVLFIYKTKMGRALRAVAQEQEAASLVGINIDNTMSLGFAISCGLAAVGGGLLVQMIPIYTHIGLALIFKIFAIVIIGGLTSLPGAIATGYLLGIGEAMVSGYIGTGYRELFFFAAMMLILVIRPSGLLGRPLLR